jgi:hypothetical protein
VVNWFVALFLELGYEACSSHSGRRSDLVVVLCAREADKLHHVFTKPWRIGWQQDTAFLEPIAACGQAMILSAPGGGLACAPRRAALAELPHRDLWRRRRSRPPPDPAPQRAPVDAKIGADFMRVPESNGRIGVAVRYG